FGARVLEALRQLPRCLVAVRIEGGMGLLLGPSEVVQIGMNRKDYLSELRRPASFLSGSSHEAFVVVDRLEQRGLERIADIENAEGAVGKAARAVGADMGEWRHQVGRAVAANPALHRNE